MTKSKTDQSNDLEGTETPLSGVFTLAPAPGCRVRKPDGTLLAEEGEPINLDHDTVYWLRRIHAGDVVILDQGEPA